MDRNHRTVAWNQWGKKMQGADYLKKMCNSPGQIQDWGERHSTLNAMLLTEKPIGYAQIDVIPASPSFLKMGAADLGTQRHTLKGEHITRD